MAQTITNDTLLASANAYSNRQPLVTRLSPWAWSIINNKHTHEANTVYDRTNKSNHSNNSNPGYEGPFNCGEYL